MSIRITAAFLMLAIAVTAVYAGEPMATGISRAHRAACLPDAVRLCRDAMPNLRGVVMCFLGQRSKLSRRCNAVLASYGL